MTVILLEQKNQIRRFENIKKIIPKPNAYTLKQIKSVFKKLGKKPHKVLK